MVDVKLRKFLPLGLIVSMGLFLGVVIPRVRAAPPLLSAPPLSVIPGRTKDTLPGGEAQSSVPSLNTSSSLPIKVGDQWRYFKGTQEPPSDWKTVGFDDSDWLVGATGIGYGDGDDATILDDMQDSYLSLYARYAFEVADPSVVSPLVFSMDYDDGFVAYLNGSELWQVDLPTEVWGNSAVSNEKLYVLGIYFYLYCLDVYTGEEIWKFEATGHCSPKVVDDKVFFSSYSGGFYCLNASNGDKIWEFDTSTDYQACTPAIVDGKVYVGNDDGIFYCLDADTGDEHWNISTGEIIWSSPAVYENKVYLASDMLYCLNASNGDEIWSDSRIVTASSPAVAYGNVYIGWFCCIKGDTVCNCSCDVSCDIFNLEVYGSRSICGI